jgi:hypothetical protein
MKTLLLAAVMAGVAIASASPALANPGDYIAIAGSNTAADFGVGASPASQQRAIELAMANCAQHANGAADCTTLASGHEGCVAIGVAGQPGRQYIVGAWGYNPATAQAAIATKGGTAQATHCVTDAELSG